MTKTRTQDFGAMMREVLAAFSRQHRLEGDVFPRNKAALLAALRARGITLVIADFDGGGDDGQIERITVHANDAEIPMPAGDVEFAMVEGHPEEVTARTITLEMAVEHLCYDVLRLAQPGWENGDGAFGQVRFDVAAQMIVLGFNGRYTTSDFSQHTY